jgi:hypothetical protein
MFGNTDCPFHLLLRPNFHESNCQSRGAMYVSFCEVKLPGTLRIPRRLPVYCADNSTHLPLALTVRPPRRFNCSRVTNFAAALEITPSPQDHDSIGTMRDCQACSIFFFGNAEPPPRVLTVCERTPLRPSRRYWAPVSAAWVPPGEPDGRMDAPFNIVLASYVAGQGRSCRIA